MQALDRAQKLYIQLPLQDQQKHLHSILHCRGILLGRLDRHSEALAVFREQISRYEATDGPSSIAVAETLSFLAAALLESGDRDGAWQSVQRALGIYTLVGDVESLGFATLLGVSGEVSRQRGHLQAALDSYTQCLALRRRFLPPEHLLIGAALNSISDLQELLGNPDAAAAAAAASIAAARRCQTICFGPNCTHRMRPDGAPRDVCVNCRCTFYCGKVCQTADWKAEHKKECKVLIAAAAAAAEAAGAKAADSGGSSRGAGSMGAGGPGSSAGGK